MFVATHTYFYLHDTKGRHWSEVCQSRGVSINFHSIANFWIASYLAMTKFELCVALIDGVK